jgi:hypothetical protein
MPTVVQVITAVEISDIDLIGVVPVVCPIRRIWVDDAKPVAAALEAGISADDQERERSNSESVPLSKVSPEAVIGYPIPSVSAALLPATVILRPVAGLALAPCAPNGFAFP